MGSTLRKNFLLGSNFFPVRIDLIEQGNKRKVIQVAFTIHLNIYVFVSRHFNFVWQVTFLTD